jgi:glycosyltransferase involved in cell wall biosynthesis
VKVLLLACNEAGELNNGPAIILTNLLEEFAIRSDVDAGLGLLKNTEASPRETPRYSPPEPAIFRMARRSSVRSVMLRAALGGPVTMSERAFLSACADQSRHFDVAVWLGLSWDPVSLKLPRACACPVVHHPTDSITLAEINRLPGIAKPLRIGAAQNLEARVLKSGYARSVYNSPQDAKYARSLVPESEQYRIVTLPIGVDTGAFSPGPEKGIRDRVRVIFSGVMNYRPNVDAALSLVNEVLPNVKADIEIRLVGRNPTDALLQLQSRDARVVVTGAVPDIADELRESDIFVAPMVSGGGISNKVLEAMACGLPVVVTPLVADNFPERPGAMWVAKTSKDIASSIDTLANNRELRTRLAIEAAEYMRTGGWSWKLRADRLIKVLRESANQ